LEIQAAWRPLALALENTGIRIDASIEIIAITTSSSMSVNPRLVIRHYLLGTKATKLTCLLLRRTPDRNEKFV
jgi:hypothetical protein